MIVTISVTEHVPHSNGEYISKQTAVTLHQLSPLNPTASLLDRETARLVRAVREELDLRTQGNTGVLCTDGKLRVRRR